VTLSFLIGWILKDVACKNSFAKSTVLVYALGSLMIFQGNLLLPYSGRKKGLLKCVEFVLSTQWHISVDATVHSHSRGNLSSCFFSYFSVY
jgi:hypothetical protein